jgi:VanZ family protein
MIKRYKYSLVLSLLILYLSLKNANDLNKIRIFNLPHFDKFAHFCMYFTLMASIILETRKASIGNRSYFFLSLYPFFYGIIMEILQGTLTSTRTASFYDVLFNTLGIIMSVLLWFLFRLVYKVKVRSL